MKNVMLTITVVPLVLIACGPANHSMKVEGVQSKIQDRKSCTTQADCDKLKADAKDLLDECKKMVSSGVWARSNCDTEEVMVKDVEKKEYSNVLRSPLSDACGTDPKACIQLMALAEAQNDVEAHRRACITGCASHKIEAACHCAEGYGEQAAAHNCEQGCKDVYLGCLRSKGQLITEREKAECAQQGNMCTASCRQ